MDLWWTCGRWIIRGESGSLDEWVVQVGKWVSEWGGERYFAMIDRDQQYFQFVFAILIRTLALLFFCNGLGNSWPVSDFVCKLIYT